MKNAKAKAIEIHNRYYSFQNPEYNMGENAKKCALIHVEEITSLLAVMNNNESFNVSEYANYWHKVKQEIEKL